MVRMHFTAVGLVANLIFVIATPAASTGSSSKTEARPIPGPVARWVSKNRPDLSFPPMEYFYGKSFRQEELDANLESNQGWPPYCIGADFNGDRKTDYALILFKPERRGGVSYWLVILHGGENGLREVKSPINHAMGSIENQIGTRLVILPQGKHAGGTGNAERDVLVERDSISLIEGFSQEFLVWNKNGYRRQSLYAD